MQIDLKADFLSYILIELQALGVSPPSKDLTECALLLFKLQRRCPESRPRSIRVSTVFTLPDELHKGFGLLCDAIRRGDNLRPYLSRQTYKVKKSDGLLDDWGIHHLHMGEGFQSNGLIEGTLTVAFALIADECVYFIDALPHGPDYPDTWVEEQLIHVIDQNWPELLASNSRDLTPDTFSSEERLRFREMRVNVTVAKPSGEVVFSPGGGFMADGTSIADFRKLQRAYADLEYLENLCRYHEAEIRAALDMTDGCIHLRGRIAGKELQLYDVVSGKRLELPFQPQIF